MFLKLIGSLRDHLRDHSRESQRVSVIDSLSIVNSVFQGSTITIELHTNYGSYKNKKV